ncbi:hypothetical protein [Chitinophaga filiformis]|uniref:Zinc-ribbon 15 domain-containing protein n=1 Tax=Chitinophaga filiformis TaxID=104663 RepID=A0ABY4IBN7_CHIFI|nr:hypothetical protein [Chitinophaga filiformis]UPK72744.1 hypothetical protein MYF79_15740 [Chitinophaga filiformis]
MSYILLQGSSSNVERIELHDCPKCKHGVLEDRVPRGFFVKYVLGLFPIRRYICYSCLKRSYVWHKPQKKQIFTEEAMPAIRTKPVAIPAH